MRRVVEDVRLRLAAAVERMSPRARQWALTAGIFGAGVALLWAVFSVGPGDDRRPVATAARDDARPTNVDLMAPGSQVKDSEVWIGKAGKDLEVFRAERDEQKRLNRELAERQQDLLRRLAEMEERLRVRTQEPAPSAPAAPQAPVLPQPASPQVAPPAPPRADFPPAGAIPRPAGTLPPPPRPPAPGAAVPATAPPAPAHPPLVRVTVSGAPSAGASADDKQAPRADPARHVSTYLPVSFVRGTLLGGLDAPTGGQAQQNPHPVLIRLADNAFLPNRFRAEYRECFVVAAGYGDISSERAYLRTESLSCVRRDGSVLEVRIQGSVYGEDGKVGMRGRLVTKQGQMLANALMAGVVGGFAQALAAYNTTFSYSALGSVATTSGKEAVYAGLGAGVSSALDRLADYYIRLAEQVFPVIEVDAGREIDVVITKGVVVDEAPRAAGEPLGAARPGATATSFRRPDPDEE